MALDKLVDSAQLDADLASVADAIRTKGGTSGSLSFPAGFVSAIEDIQTGGGGFPAPISQVATGSFTLAEDVTTYTITHNLGVRPQLIFVWCEGFDYTKRDYNLNSTNSIVAAQVDDSSSFRNWLYSYRNSTSSGNMSSTLVTYENGDATAQIFKIHNCGTLRANLATQNGTNTATWRWLVLAVGN